MLHEMRTRVQVGKAPFRERAEEGHSWAIRYDSAGVASDKANR